MFYIEFKNLEEIQGLFDKFPVEVSKNYNRAIAEILTIAQRYAIMGSPVNTGKLRSSFELSVGLMEGTLRNTADYAYWVAVGRQPGSFPPISAIEKWVKEKGIQASPFAVAKSIQQKGTPANPFWEDALGLAEKASLTIFDKAMKKTLNDISKK